MPRPAIERQWEHGIDAHLRRVRELTRTSLKLHDEDVELIKAYAWLAQANAQAALALATALGKSVS